MGMSLAGSLSSSAAASVRPLSGSIRVQAPASASVLRRDDWMAATYRDPAAMWFHGYPWENLLLGRMGDERVTTRNVIVVRVDPEKNLLLVRGAVPGHNQALVRIRPAVAPKRVPAKGKAEGGAAAKPAKKK